MPIQRCTEAGEGIDPVLRATAFLQPRDDRLGRAHPFGELALAQAGLGPQVVDELSEVEIESTLGRRRWLDASAVPQLRPMRCVRAVRSSSCRFGLGCLADSDLDFVVVVDRGDPEFAAGCFDEPGHRRKVQVLSPFQT